MVRMEGGAMEERHLSLITLAKLATGRIGVEEIQQLVIPHLVGVCAGCREIHQELQRLKQEVGHWDEMVVVLEGLDAPELWRRLEPLPYDQQLRQVEEDGGLQTWALCRLLLRKSLEATFHRPDLAVQLAFLAVKISIHLGEAYHRDWVMDLRALAFAYLGNARRVVGELQSAADAFHEAHSHLRRSGTGNPRVEAEILHLEASLRREERRFGAALELLERVIAAYTGEDPDTRDLHLAGQALVKKAYTLEQMGDVEQAIAMLREAAPLVVEERDPRLVLCLRHNLVWFLLPAAGKSEEAAALLPGVKELALRLGNDLDLVRLRWAEGRVAFGSGDRGPAEQAFKEVQREFLERDMGYDAALVSLDLAILYAQEGCIPELKQLALDILPVFSSREVHREAMAALLLFQHACEEERLTVELARQLASLLARERPHSPIARRGSAEPG
jgi:tetratricopeptide (TPR) repeat protein